jgi:hypothetical protein
VLRCRTVAGTGDCLIGFSMSRDMYEGPRLVFARRRGGSGVGSFSLENRPAFLSSRMVVGRVSPTFSHWVNAEFSLSKSLSVRAGVGYAVLRGSCWLVTTRAGAGVFSLEVCSSDWLVKSIINLCFPSLDKTVSCRTKGYRGGSLTYAAEEVLILGSLGV